MSRPRLPGMRCLSPVPLQSRIWDVRLRLRCAGFIIVNRVGLVLGLEVLNSGIWFLTSELSGLRHWTTRPLDRLSTFLSLLSSDF